MTEQYNRELVAALRALPGIADADVEPDSRPEGAGTLRLRLLPGADEASVAATVNQILRERFGLSVDTNRLRVVEEAAPARSAPSPLQTPQQSRPFRSAPEPEPGLQPPPPMPPMPPPSPAPSATAAAARSTDHVGRLLIHRLQLVSAGLGVTATVTLSRDGETQTGEVEGPATAVGLHRCVSEATLRAAEALVHHRVRFDLQHLEVPALGGDRAVVVQIGAVTARGNESLTGVSAVREDVRQAVIRATLDALNRRLAALLAPAGPSVPTASTRDLNR